MSYVKAISIYTFAWLSGTFFMSLIMDQDHIYTYLALYFVYRTLTWSKQCQV